MVSGRSTVAWRGVAWRGVAQGAGGEQGGGDVLLPGQGAVREELEDRHTGLATHCSCVGEVLAREDVLHLELDRVCCCIFKHFLKLLKPELEPRVGLIGLGDWSVKASLVPGN